MEIYKDVEESYHSCVPSEHLNNKYAICFAISDNYSFAAANVIMGLYKHSAPLMQNCDIQIYHNGISLKNKERLRLLHADTFFQEARIPEEWEAMLTHEKTVTFGIINIWKFFCYDLVKHYSKVLLLDADVMVRGDVSELFDLEEDMAWRNVVAWKAKDIFANVLKKPDDCISAGNGGMILFNGNIKKYAIGQNEILEAYEQIEDLDDGGIDEDAIAYLSYKYQMSVRELDVKIWNTPIQRLTPETKLVHFLDYAHTTTKPWKNLATYLYFEQWAENYQRWLDLGGEGPVNFTREDYYNLFSFDKLKKIEKQEKQLKNTKKKFLNGSHSTTGSAIRIPISL